NRRPDRVLAGQLVPRVRLDLLEAERDAAAARIDAQDHGLDQVALIEDLRRVLDALAPGHLGDVDQSLDARLELDERAVVGQADDLAVHARRDRVAGDDVAPRVGRELLVAERDALGGGVVLEHHHVDLVVDLEDLRRVLDGAPRHVRDVEQAVDAAEVDERAVVGDVLDHAAQDLALGQRVQRVLLLLGVLLLEEDLAREDDVAALLVDLDDPHAQVLALERVEVPHRADVDLRAGEERADADVDREAALDALDDPADDHLVVGEGLLDLVPDLHLLGFFAREDDMAVTILWSLDQDVDPIAGLDGDRAGLVDELVEGDHPLRLEADVDDDFVLG